MTSSQMARLNIIQGCHESSKHAPGHYARGGPGGNPDVFLEFQNVPVLKLPIPTPCAVPYSQLFEASSPPSSAALSIPSISEFLYYSLALSAVKRKHSEHWSLRVWPSAGALYPLEAYLVLPSSLRINIPGFQLPAQQQQPSVDITPAIVAHYSAKNHMLELRSAFHPDLWSKLFIDASSTSSSSSPSGLSASQLSSCFFVVLTAIHFRMYVKYGDRAYRFAELDAGHAIGALRLSAARLGWGCTLLAHPGSPSSVLSLADILLSRLIGCSRDADFDPAERQDIVCAALIYPYSLVAPSPSPAIAAAASASSSVASSASVSSSSFVLSSPSRLYLSLAFSVVSSIENGAFWGKAPPLAARHTPVNVVLSSASACQVPLVAPSLSPSSPSVPSAATAVSSVGSRKGSEQGASVSGAVAGSPASSITLSSASSASSSAQSAEAVDPESLSALFGAVYREGLFAGAIVRQRRSADDYNTSKFCSASAFWAMMGRCLPHLSPVPFDVFGPSFTLPSAPASSSSSVSPPIFIHCGILVHRVAGVTPGLYFLARCAPSQLSSSLSPLISSSSSSSYASSSPFLWGSVSAAPPALRSNFLILSEGSFVEI